MRDIRPACEIIFKASFEKIILNRDKMKFEILLLDPSKSVIDEFLDDFKKKYPMCLIKIAYSNPVTNAR